MFNKANTAKHRSFGKLTAGAVMTRRSVNRPVMEQAPSKVDEQTRREWMGR